MDIVQLKKQIKQKKLSNFYVFTGEEIGLMNEYIQRMGSVNVRADEVLEVWGQLTNSSISKNDTVYCVRDDKKFMQNEKAWTDIDKKIKSGTLIAIVSNIDKRGKFYKHFQDRIISFDKMSEKQLIQVAKKQLPGLTASTYSDLVYLCLNDYTRMMNEVDKLNRIGKKVTSKLLFEIIPQPNESDSFEWVNLLMRLDPNAIYELQDLLEKGESPVMLLGLLYSNFRNAVLVLGNNKGHGVNGYVAKLIKERVNYSPEIVIKAVRVIQRYEMGIKTGRYEQAYAVEACTLEILSLR